MLTFVRGETIGAPAELLDFVRVRDSDSCPERFFFRPRNRLAAAAAGPEPLAATSAAVDRVVRFGEDVRLPVPVGVADALLRDWLLSRVVRLGRRASDWKVGDPSSILRSSRFNGAVLGADDDEKLLELEIPPVFTVRRGRDSALVRDGEVTFSVGVSRLDGLCRLLDDSEWPRLK